MRLLEYALACVEREMASSVKVPWRVRPGLWRRGFLSEAWVLYGLAANDRNAYVTDYQRFVTARLINGPYAILLDDKLQFARLVGDAFPDRVPALYGVLAGGRVVGTNGAHANRPPAGPPLEDLLRREGSVVVKPSTGGGGIGFALLEDDGAGGVRHNGHRIGAQAFAELAAMAEGQMVTAFVRQHPVLAGLYPRTTNTIRLVTMQDEEAAPFIATAVLRIGSARSVPTDNWRKGGLSAAIDLADGTLGRAAAYPAEDDRLRWHARHPESDAPIEGVALPHWDRITAGILEIAAAFPFLRYVGWDIAVTQDGFAVIEGNNYTGTNLLQIHRPLLTDPKVAAFLHRHGVPAKRRRARARPAPATSS